MDHGVIGLRGITGPPPAERELRSPPVVSATTACGFLLMLMCVRPTYSPRIPRNSICSPPMTSTMTISEAQPAALLPKSSG